MDGQGGVDESKRATLRRFAALGAASSFVGLASAEGDDSDVRDAITGYLATTPGAHFSKLRDDLQLGTGETQHHLKRLEESGVVESWKDGDYRRSVVANRFSGAEKTTLGYLRRSTPRGMLLALLGDPTLSAGELADVVGVSRPSVSKHAADLDSAGILSRDEGYAIREPEAVLTLVVRYADSFGDDAVELAAAADELVTYDP